MERREERGEESGEEREEKESLLCFHMLGFSCSPPSVAAAAFIPALAFQSRTSKGRLLPFNFRLFYVRMNNINPSCVIRL